MNTTAETPQDKGYETIKKLMGSLHRPPIPFFVYISRTDCKL